jgi:hypothetical protein
VLALADGNVADAAAAANIDADRWVNEGGRFPGADRAVGTARPGARA